MTPEQIAIGTGATLKTATAWQASILAACARFDISTPLRQAAFLSQIGVETGGLADLRENLNYSEAALLEQWPDHFDAADAAAYGRTDMHPANQEMIANIAYANRYGNGDIASGDGWRFRGGGCIDTTFRDNYRDAGVALGIPLEAHPELIAQPDAAALTAAYYWHQHGCNAMADAGLIDAITQAITGGANAAARRRQLYAQGIPVLTA